MPRPWRPLVPLLLSASLALGWSACGADDEPDASPGTPSSSSPPSRGSGTSTSPSAEPEPEVEPATGPRVRLPVLQVRLPDDTWTLSSVDGGFGGGYTKDGTGEVLVNQFPVISSRPDLDRLAKIRLQQVRENESFPMAFGDDVTIDGVEARTIVGAGGGTHVYLLEALLLAPEPLTVSLQIRTLGGKALHRERVESVLATWEWR